MLSEKCIRDTYDIGKADLIRMADSISHLIAIDDLDQASAVIARLGTNLMGLVILENILYGGEEGGG